MLLRLNPLNEAEALEAPPFVALVGRLFFCQFLLTCCCAEMVDFTGLRVKIIRIQWGYNGDMGDVSPT